LAQHKRSYLSLTSILYPKLNHFRFLTSRYVHVLKSRLHAPVIPGCKNIHCMSIRTSSTFASLAILIHSTLSSPIRTQLPQSCDRLISRILLSLGLPLNPFIQSPIQRKWHSPNSLLGHLLPNTSRNLITLRIGIKHHLHGRCVGEHDGGGF